MIHDFKEDLHFEETIQFGDFVRKKRRIMGLNQSDFAELMGVTQKTVSFWEKGFRTPPLDQAKYIIKSLGGEFKIINRVSLHNCKTVKRELLERFPNYPVDKLCEFDDEKKKEG